jgi:hypothetical protein
MPVKRYPKVPTVDTSTRVSGQVAEPEAECREIGSPAPEGRICLRNQAFDLRLAIRICMNGGLFCSKWASKVSYRTGDVIQMYVAFIVFCRTTTKCCRAACQ